MAKKVLKGNGASCVPADVYAARFSKSMKEYIKLVEEEVDGSFNLRRSLISEALDSFLP